MAIRYDPELNDYMARVLRNYNAKVKRLDKAGQTILPEKASLKQLKSNTRTRRELFKELDKLSKFTQRGAERIIENQSGLALTKYQWEILKAEKKASAISLTRDIESLPLESRGNEKKLEERYKTLRAKRNALNVDLNTISQEKYKQLVNITTVQAKSQTYKANFKDGVLSAIEETMQQVGYSEEEINATIRQMRKYSVKEIERMYYEDDIINSLFAEYELIKKALKKGKKPADIKKEFADDISAITARLVRGDYS